jgi:predicted nucleic acid-binding protein
VRPEILICDTSFVGHLLHRKRRPRRYSHWDEDEMLRIESATLALSIVTVAESRAGYRSADWGGSRVANAERELGRFFQIPVRRRYVDEWARLWVAARKAGIALSDNDLWVAATASRREQVLVTCDRDHVRIAKELPVEVLYLAPPL